MKKIIIVITAIIMTVILTANYDCSIYADAPSSQSNLNDYISEEFDKTNIPGMSVQVVSANEVLFSATYGNCNNISSPFIIGSMSKSFTAAAIMQLVEQGKINLSDPFSKYLHDADKNITTTVKQLLNQTSGIKTYDTLENYTPSNSPVNYEYSNVNYGILGKIIEQVSGMDYGTYIEKNIFTPLNMHNSFISIQESKSNGLIPGYRNYFGFMVEKEMPYPQQDISGWLNLPSAYIISSAEDIGKYLQSYLNEGNRILSPNSVNTMINDNVEVQKDYKYGMGWGLDYRTGELILTHGGNVENYTTNMQILPEQGIAVVVMTNACDFFVSNELALQLAYNISYKLINEPTDNIKENTYLQKHLIINLILLSVLLISFLPIISIKKWHTKITHRTLHLTTIWLCLIHAILPTFILFAVLILLKTPMSIVLGFAPDVFLVQIVSSLILYLTGIYKLIFILYRRLNKLSS